MCCCLAQFPQRTCSARCPAACLSFRPRPSTRWQSEKSSDASRRPNASTPLSSAESFAGKTLALGRFSFGVSTLAYLILNMSVYLLPLLITLATTLKEEKVKKRAKFKLACQFVSPRRTIVAAAALSATHSTLDKGGGGPNRRSRSEKGFLLAWIDTTKNGGRFSKWWSSRAVATWLIVGKSGVQERRRSRTEIGFHLSSRRVRFFFSFPGETVKSAIRLYTYYSFVLFCFPFRFKYRKERENGTQKLRNPESRGVHKVFSSLSMCVCVGTRGNTRRERKKEKKTEKKNEGR